MPFSRAVSAEVTAGGMAPDFALVDQYGKMHKLSDYRGTWVILYFYPKDDTPGCTKEACHFRDDIFRVHKLHAEILGISVDAQASHAKFSEKYSLPFPLLVDTGGRVAQSYSSLWSLGPIKVARRHTFIIDGDGKIAKIYRDVDPDTHSNEIIQDLQKLQATGSD
jgi:peroxiredoxin Q/BCP